MELDIWYYFVLRNISNSIKCLISQESVITYIISNNYAKTKIGLYDFLPVEKNIDFA